MELRGEEIPEGKQLETTACIIGGGVAGMTIARELADSGVEVVVLERGDARSPDQPVTDGLVFADREFPLPESRGRGLGGSSKKWKWNTPLGSNFGQLPPLDPGDFEADPPDLAGWPISYEEFSGYFERAAAHCRMGRFSTNAERSESPLAPEGIEMKPFHCGPAAAFWSDATESLRRHPRVRLVSRAYAVELDTTRDDGALSEVRVASEPGRTFGVRARLFVLAAGGIENARILLSSRTSDETAIGNQYDWVGRCFMEHLNHVAGYLVPTDPSLLRRDELFAMQGKNGSVHHLKYQIAPSLRRRWELPNVIYEFAAENILLREGLTWEDNRHFAGPQAFRALVLKAMGSEEEGVRDSRVGALLRTAMTAAPVLAQSSVAKGIGTLARLVDAGPRLLKVRGCAEQYPHPDSRVVLTGERDDYGVEVAALSWRVSDRDLRGIRESQARLAELLKEGGVGTLHSSYGRDGWEPRIGIGYHHMGTTRMSDSPRDGVVDPDCRVHGMKNLYVAGSSVFCSGGAANPTFSLVALAIRLADHLQEQIQGVPRVEMPA